MAVSRRKITKKQWASAPPDHSWLLIDLLKTRHRSTLVKDAALAARLERYLPDFWDAYVHVYGAGYDRIDDVLRLFAALMAGHAERSEDLRALDTARTSEDDWYQRPDLVGISLYVDLFAGTLDGVREKIPYLKELGVTYVHLMPLLKSREGLDDGGYAVADYRAVEPRLGTMDDLRALARTLHEAGMVLALDFVMNHTAQEHPWAQAALAGDAERQAFYLMFDDRRLPDAFERTLPEVFPDFAPGNFTFFPEVEKWVWTSFYAFQWDLDYRNPAVFQAMYEEMFFLANAGADVLRLDAVPFLWKEMDTNCRNLPEAHWLLRAYRALIRIAAPGVLFKAEAIVAPDDIIRYLGVGGYEDKECEMAYNATLMCHLWHALACENTRLLRTALTTLPATPEGALWLNYIRCHDDIGWGLSDENCAAIGQGGFDTRMYCSDFYAGDVPHSISEGYRFQVDPQTGEARTSGTAAALAGLQKARVEGTPAQIDAAVNRLLLLNSVIFTMRGAPLLFSGDEVGQLNDFSYLDDPVKTRDNRWVHRPRMDWARAEEHHKPETITARLFDGISGFARARKHIPALHARATEHILYTENDALFVLERTRGAGRLLVVSNFSDSPQRLPLADLPLAWQHSAFTDVLGDEHVFFPSGHILLPPYGFLWLKPAPDAAPGAPVKTTVTVDVETVWGEEVYLFGTLPELGGGDPRHAIGPLDAGNYPRWNLELAIPEGTCFEFRWIKKRHPHIVAWSERTYWMKAGGKPIFTL